jgi:GntR family transcriptional regulator / MocR family aminotransferase
MSRPRRPRPYPPKVILARTDDIPIYRQIYEHFRTTIRAGQLDRLPSARALAGEFATARGTVDAAYAMLSGEGYIVSRGPSGTIVSPEFGHSKIAKPEIKRHHAGGAEPPAATSPRPFQMGLPAFDAFRSRASRASCRP